MASIGDLGGVTTAIVKLALDASVLRHQVIASNVANAGSVDKRPRVVEFESALARRLESVEPRVRIDGRLSADPDQELAVDQQMVEATANALRYQALLAGLSKRGEIIGLAVRGGRG